MLLRVAVLPLDAGIFTDGIDLVGAAPQGDFPQCGQIWNGEKVRHGPLGLLLAIDLAAFQPFHQFGRLDIHDLHLIGPVKDRIRNPLPDGDAGDGGHRIVQTFNMLHIDGGIDIDAGLQQLVHILIALFMPGAGGVAVGQFVHQNEPGLSLQRPVQIKFPKENIPVGYIFHRNLLQIVYQLHRLRAGVRLDIAHHHINALTLCGMGGFQHGIGLADAGGVAEKDFELSFFGIFRLDLPEKLLGILSSCFHGGAPFRISFGFMITEMLFRWYKISAAGG